MLPKREVIVIHSDSEDDFQEYPRFKRPREQEVKERRQTPKKRRNSVPPASLSKKAVVGLSSESKRKPPPKAEQKQAETESKPETPLKQATLSSWLGCAPPKPPSTPMEVNTEQKTRKQNGWWNRERKTVPTCPFYKRIPFTPFLVDAFQNKYETPKDPIFFLTHFHSDHYGGLNSTFSDGLIYCSKITANLVQYKLGVKPEFICPLPMNEPIAIQEVSVTLLDAHHCPGAVLLLFQMPDGKTHLHTGDFRFNKDLPDHIYCSFFQIDNLFLDTTYCDPSYVFPSQAEVISACLTALGSDFKRADTAIAVGSYTIGKEKLFIGMAQYFNCKIYVSTNKMNIIKRLELPADILQLFVSDKNKAKIHVLTMAEFSYAKLGEYRSKLQWPISRIVAVKPTGWTFNGNKYSKAAQPKTGQKRISKRYGNKEGTVSILEVPYSEHSSFEELRDFVALVNPKFIVPTVNCHNPVEVKALLRGTN